MTEKEVLTKVADSATDEPVKISIKNKPQNLVDRLLMWLKIKPSQTVYEISGATLGTMLKISKLLLLISYENVPKDQNRALSWAYESVVNNADTMVKIIATAIHNKRSPYPKELETVIYDNYEAKDIYKVAIQVINSLDCFTFTNTITLIRPQNILEKRESLQPEEIIAPEITTGEQLEMLQNIFGSASIA